MYTIFLLHFLSLCAYTLAFNVPQDWIIGLRANCTLKNHLALLNTPIDIKQYVPQINGYAITPSANDENLLSSTRQDPGVGFIVPKPQGFFFSNGHIGLEGDDLDDYEVERMWLTLQDQDPEVIVTDDGGVKIPYTYRIFFTDKAAKEKHLETVGIELDVSYVFLKSYCVVFNDQVHEREYLALIKDDSSVVAVYPERTRQGIFYDEMEGSHVKPYRMEDIVIHEG